MKVPLSGLMIALLLGWGLLAGPWPAYADDCSGPSTSSDTDATTGVTGILLNGEKHAAGSAPCDTPASTSSVSSGPRDSGLDTLCVRQALSQGRNPFAFCDLNLVLDRTKPLTITPGMAAVAFRRIPLPASVLRVQPPNGRTLVNFDTNFYTEQAGFDRTVRLLGRRVDLRIWPSGFSWVFGDGADLLSVSAGAPYPRLLITHRYLRRAVVSPRVDTTYSATFRVDGGVWRDVVGTVTIPGGPVPLRVVTASPVLVGAR